ncbi:tetratricopeptide repeat protein [Desulfurivibrio sp. C05AmB]|uniref:tetratricopeptide repeat protein n=1 Tax=Desulfurivibrio sp. C05AmB TaxID=3374371 RepID=UPI00376F4524
MNGNKILMLTALILAAVGLAAGCASRPAAPPAEPVPAPRYAAELEPYEEAVDPACAYFQFTWGKITELGCCLEDARYAYQQALICDRKADYVMRSLAMLLLRMGERAEAIAWVQRIIELKPADLSALSLLANLYTTASEVEKAVAVYRNILTIEPGNANAMLMLGVLYAGSEREEQAQAVFEELVALHPEFFLGHYYLARFYRDMGAMDRALAAYDRALALNWTPAMAQEAAAAYESAGLYEQSLRLYRQMIADDPTDERARGLLANIYLRLDRVEEALAELAELRHYSADVDNIDLTIARILLDEERYQEALILLHEMLSDEPRLDAVRSLLVLGYYRSGQVARARALLEEIRPGDYGYEEAVLMLARIYHGAEDPVTAARILDRALAEPEHRYLSFYVTLALLHAEWHDAGQGILVFDRALRDLGPTARVFFEYALYLDRIGDGEGALAKMQEVIARDPQDPFALNYVGYTWADRGENLTQALTYIEEAVRLRPEDGSIRDSLGWVYYRLGDYRRAVEELELAVELLPDDPVIYDHLGEAYRELGQRGAALTAYRRALELLDPLQEREKRMAIEEKIEELAR